MYFWWRTYAAQIQTKVINHLLRISIHTSLIKVIYASIIYEKLPKFWSPMLGFKRYTL